MSILKVALSIFILIAISTVAMADTLTFPFGDATPSATCGECHKAIYREYTTGEGSDMHILHANSQIDPAFFAKSSSTATAHATADINVKQLDRSGEDKICLNCHIPGIFKIPKDRDAGKFVENTKSTLEGGITCVTCHLTPEGKIRSVFNSKNAPHETIVDPALQSSSLCAHCHTDFFVNNKRVDGKMFQTYFEWRDDYKKAGLGNQECQGCHMPRTVRKVAEDFDGEKRTVGRHTWAGGHSRQKHLSSLSLNITQPVAEKQELDFSITNIGAGHSVPTGFLTRAVFLSVEISDDKGIKRANNEWMFAGNCSSRPDDRSFLEQDKKLTGRFGATQTLADTQGSHEAPIHAGETRTLSWLPTLEPGEYIVSARLFYTLNRFSNSPINDADAEIGHATLAIYIK